MIFDLVETITDVIADLIDGGDAVEGLDSDAMAGAPVSYGQSMSPISSEVESTLYSNTSNFGEFGNFGEFDPTLYQNAGNLPDDFGTVESGAMPQTTLPYGQTVPPVSGDMNQAVTDLVNNVGGDVAAMEEMSLEELAEHNKELAERNAMLGNLTGGYTASSEITNSVDESMAGLAEREAQSFGSGGFYTPFEGEGVITLDTSNVSYDISEFEQHSNGILEQDGRFFEESTDGVFHEIDADEADL